MTHSYHETRPPLAGTGLAFTETDSEGKALRQCMQHSATPAGFTSIEYSFGQIEHQYAESAQGMLQKKFWGWHTACTFFFRGNAPTF